ncbi:major facilitator superfamily MFS_1 [Pseudarthrobacter chlorophenolicus A6]|uniref:Major facilitator superfamily MFS_1 n=1 Tax=Pseudarthrobacter chlorophenolicus (strain ATCC 700700 / DSM 12829 / CIP 107037 / JCM 12360 / KCTC 9906 / NCIMB 13794 / A6) TaxID=452863 RepID=B8H7C7_PSECP|nr:MFS transporter [Pseudarthrobacter chlorophenolicus]ACL41729.1 major facilitator superfamily MFS_1 [Pseudarthrobacter chlorophenolicus A6]SDQ59386.1 Major Facilitator Superfamily protein [Pseudarthrobacter chlorophenolicus]
MSMSNTPVPPVVPRTTTAALAEPTQKVTARWVTGLVLVNVGINAAFFGPINVFIGQQAISIDSPSKEAILSLVTACGAAVSLVANPLFGALSDRTTSRFGRRSPWVLLGAVLAAAALLAMSVSASVALMVLFWCLVQLGANAAYAAIFAAVPDRVPVPQRGGVGGLAAMGQTLGVLTGAVFGAVVSGNFMVGYWLCAGALLVSVLPYLFHCNDPALPKSELGTFNLRSFAKGFYISPVRYPDFGWAWLTRLLVNVGNQLTIVYLLFFLRDIIKHGDPAFGVLVLTGIYAVMVMITAVIAGPWSDRVGKRKPFVIGSSATIAMAALIMAFFPVWPGALAGAAVLGIGFGAYLAVDFALLTQVLPKAADRGKDLGVINIASSLPQVIAPLLAFLALKFFGGYGTLFTTAAVIGLLGAVFVVKIKGVD